MSRTNDWKYFTEKELGCKGTGECFYGQRVYETTYPST